MHTALAVLLYFGLPSFTRAPPGIEQFVTVELVSEPPDAEPEPPEPAPAATAPEPPRVAAAPEPPPPPEPVAEPEPEPEPAPPPEPEPEIAQPAEPEPAPPPPEPEPAPPPEPEPELAQPVEPEPAPEPEPEPEPQRAAPRPSLKPPPPRQLAEATPEPEPQKPEPPKPTPAMAPKPEPETPPEAPKEDQFAALLRSVEQMERREQASTERDGTGRILAEADGQARSRIGEGRITQSERDALYRQITRNWILPAGAQHLEEIVVQLRIQVGPDRTVRGVVIQDQARLESDPTFRAVAESAYRAVERSSPLQLPPDKYTLWRDLVLNFRPQDAIGG
jgi:hypothetical protein